MAVIKVRDGDNQVYYMEVAGDGSVSNPFVPIHSSLSTGPQKPLILRYMDTVGDGSGDFNMGVDGSVTPQIFRIKPPPGQVYRIARMIMTVVDGGSFDSGGWGNGSALTNGQEFETEINGVTTDGLNGHPIRMTADVAAICHDLTHRNFGSGDEFFTARLTFTKMGEFVRLDGDTNDEIRFIINDDQSNLVNQRIMVQGYIE